MFPYNNQINVDRINQQIQELERLKTNFQNVPTPTNIINVGNNSYQRDITNEFLFNNLNNEVRANGMAIQTSSSTITANNVIPLTLKYNTNVNTSFNNNTISINRGGYYEINGTFNFTATGTTTNITLYANGVAIPETATTITTTSGDEFQITIHDVEKVIRQYTNTDKVELTFVSTTGLTILSTDVSVVEIR